MVDVTARHRPFADGKFKGLWDSLKNSPYPWHYTARWPWYFHHPSTRNHSGVGAQPDRWRDGNAPPDSGSLRLLFAGDIMVLNGDRTPRLCRELRSLIGGCDLFIANLEAPLGRHAPDPDRKYTFRFHMPRAVLSGIQAQVGLPFHRWILGNANNHSGDAGLSGFEQSIELLDGLGVQHVGHPDSGQPLRVVERNGFRLGMQAWTHWLNRDVFRARQPVVAAGDAMGLAARATAPPDLDFRIGLPHWEFEFQHFPRQATRRHAQQLLGAGFDLLVGSHPHVLQPCERFGDGLCFYSLGNFCGLGIAWPVKIIPLLALELHRRHDGRAQVTGYQLHYFHQIDGNDETSIVPLDVISAPRWQRAAERISRVYTHSLR